jgi:hypothetical protein
MQFTDKQAYSVAEVAAITGFSRQTITRLFEHEKGVLIVGRAETLHKRAYRSIRIPHPVVERVMQKLTVR